MVIGDNFVVAAGAVVTNSVPPNVVAVIKCLTDD